MNAHSIDPFTIDFEATGVDPKTCHPVEVAITSSLVELSKFIKPPIPIPPETSAIHHIIDEDVELADSWEVVKAQLCDMFRSDPGQPLPILVAHNAEYERNVLGDDFVPVIWVCTYKCALRVWPDAPSHKNEVLRYWLKLGDNRGRLSHQRPHSALHDTQVTQLILRELLKHATIEQLVEWTELPAKLPKMPMGKHFGAKWEDVPGDYLQWITKQADMREDVKFCASEELKRRRNPHATQRSS